MKCVGCGAENPGDIDTCQSCGLPLVPEKPEMSDPGIGVPVEDIGVGYSIQAPETDGEGRSRARRRRREEASSSGLRGPLLAVVALVAVAVLAVGGWVLWRGIASSSAKGVALEYMSAVEGWDAERVWELTNPSVRGDKKTFIDDMKFVRDQVKGSPILKDAKVTAVKEQGKNKALVTMSYQVLKDPAKKTYEAGQITLTMLRKDGKWYYESGAL